MEQGEISNYDFILWNKLCQVEIDFFTIRWEFISRSNNRELVIRQALNNPSDRGTALRLLLYLNVEERLKYFDELVDLASVGHSDIGLVREVILTLPREYLLANIEKSAEPLLLNANTIEDGYEEYTRYLELYSEIDTDMTRRLALRAIKNDNEDIREAGEDFLEFLDAQD